jgi:hypothetical protein
MMKIQQRGMDSEYPDAGGDNINAVPEDGAAEGEVVLVSEVVDYDETNGDGTGGENADEDADEDDEDADEDEEDADEDEEDADEDADEGDADEEDADEEDADEEDADEEDADEDNEDADEDITDGDEPDEEANEGEQDDDAVVALEILEEELDEIEELVDAEFNPESAITLNDDDDLKSTSHDDQLDQSTYEILADDDDTMELNNAGGNLSPTTEQNSKFIQTFANNKSTYLLVAILLVCGIGLLTKVWARNTNKYDRRRRTKIAHKRLPTIDDDSV